MLDHELWTNHHGKLPTLFVSPGETFEFRNVPAGKCKVGAQRIVASEGSMKPKPPIEVDVAIKNGQQVEVELSFDKSQASSVWGPAVNGIQFRLRAEKPTWPQGTLPKFFADLRNRGKLDRRIALEHESWEFEVDGKRYPNNFGIEGDRRYLPLGPGQEQRDLDVWIFSEENVDRKLRTLDVGKHTVRITRLFHEGAFEDRMSVVSNPIEIEITAKPDVTFEAEVVRTVSFNFFEDEAHLDLDTGRYGKEHRGKDITAAMGESDMRVRSALDMVAIPVDASQYDCTPKEVLDAVGRAKSQRQVRLGGPETRRTFFFKTREGGAGVLQITPKADQPGLVNVRYKLVQPRTAGEAPLSREASSDVEAAKQWGAPTNGVQCRIQPVKYAWPIGETPRLTVFVQKTGEVDLLLSTVQLPTSRLFVDGRHYRHVGENLTGVAYHPSSFWEKNRPFSVTIDDRWQHVDDGKPLAMMPGKHTIQYGWPGFHPAAGSPGTGLRPDESTPILLMSNPSRVRDSA